MVDRRRPQELRPVLSAQIEQHRVTDWERNHDVQREMRRGLDDLFYAVEEQTGALIEAEQLNQMIDQ